MLYYFMVLLIHSGFLKELFLLLCQAYFIKLYSHYICYVVFLIVGEWYVDITIALDNAIIDFIPVQRLY